MEGTTIFKNAEDYVLVLLITDYGLAFHWMICPIAFQSMFIKYDKPRTLQSNANMFPLLVLGVPYSLGLDLGGAKGLERGRRRCSDTGCQGWYIFYIAISCDVVIAPSFFPLVS